MCKDFKVYYWFLQGPMFDGRLWRITAVSRVTREQHHRDDVEKCSAFCSPVFRKMIGRLAIDKN